MTAIPGLSAFYHDSAAALLVDGTIVAAAQEERFTRVKNDDAFPAQAVQYCLDQAGLSPAGLDYVGFYDKPLLKFERLLETDLADVPPGGPPARRLQVARPGSRDDLHWLERAVQRGGGARAINAPR